MHLPVAGLIVFLTLSVTTVRSEAPPKNADDIKFSATPQKGVVVNLTNDNFEDVVHNGDSKLTFVKFYAPWCGHCKDLAPEYERAAADPELSNVTFAQIDCDQHSKPCEQFKIEGYPTILAFKQKQSEPSKCEFARKSESISAYVKNLLRPLFTSVFEQEELKEQLRKNPKATVVYMDTPEIKAILSAAEKTKQEAQVIVVFNSELASKVKKEENSTSPVFIQFHDGESKKNFSGEVTEESIDRFIRNASIPMLAEIGPENYVKYVNTGLPISFFFYEGKEMKDKHAQILSEVAPAYKDKTNFVFIDAVKYKAYASALNVTPKSGKTELEWPCFVIHDVTKDTKYVFEGDEITKDSLTKFMDTFAKGTIKATVKSQAVPKENNGPVKVVVHQTFNEIVMDKKKDVLIDLYAPWCGMCKRIEPYYEKLAALLKDHQGIVLAKMDATLNDLPSDIPFKLEHYPTLKLFKANTNEIVDCDNFLDIKAMHDFLKANTVNNKFNIDAEITKFMAEETAKTQKPAGKDTSVPEDADDDEAEQDEL